MNGTNGDGSEVGPVSRVRAPAARLSGVMTPKGEAMSMTDGMSAETNRSDEQQKFERGWSTALEERHGELMVALRERHPGTDLLHELDSLTGALMMQCEDFAVALHGKAILAAITGQLRVHPGSMPQWQTDDGAAEL